MCRVITLDAQIKFLDRNINSLKDAAISLPEFVETLEMFRALKVSLEGLKTYRFTHNTDMDKIITELGEHRVKPSNPSAYERESTNTPGGDRQAGKPHGKGAGNP
jgi:hypothetical protein